MKEHKEQPVQLIVQNCPAEEDEIDLRELYKTIKRNKKIVIITTILFVFLATIYVLIKKPIFIVEAHMKPGYYLNPNPKAENIKIFIQEPEELKVFLASQYGKRARENKVPYLEATIDRKAQEIIKVKVFGHSNDSAKEYLDKAIKSINEQDEKFIRTYKNNIEAKINLNRQIIKNLEKEIALLKSKLKLTDIDVQTIKVLYEQLNSLQSKLIDLKQQNLDLEAKLSPTFIQPTKIIGQVLVDDKPAKPKKKLILAVALISGLIVGIFLVFFLEFLKNINEEEK